MAQEEPRLGGIADRGIYDLNTFTSDEAILPLHVVETGMMVAYDVTSTSTSGL